MIVTLLEKVEMNLMNIDILKGMVESVIAGNFDGLLSADESVEDVVKELLAEIDKLEVELVGMSIAPCEYYEIPDSE